MTANLHGRGASGEPPEDIPQRELRNDIARVLREAEAGKSFRVTVAGRPVAELGPMRPALRGTPAHLAIEFIREARANSDPDFWNDVRPNGPEAPEEDVWERYGTPDT